MAKVFVTGANGFIGSHLVDKLLAQGDEVTCLVRATAKRTRLHELPVQIVAGDVTRPDTLGPGLRTAEIVYHLAGATKSLRKQHLWDVNEGGVRHVLEACAERETPPVVLLISSIAAAGPARHGTPITEEVEPAPVSNYGRSKLAGERVAREFAARLPITIMRPPVVFGEADPYSIDLFRPVARLGMLIGPGLRQARFSLIHADDLVQAMILAVSRGQRLPPVPGQRAEPDLRSGAGIYFAAADEHPLFGEWARLIATALGRRRVLVIMPPGGYLVWPVAAVMELISRVRGSQAIFNWDKAREVFAGSWWCSDRALRAATGFQPAATLSVRLRQTADWYRAAGWV